MGEGTPAGDKITREELAGCSGLVLLLLACLLLTTAPQSVYRWSQRDGYTRTEIEVLSPPDSHLRSMRVRVLSTGETLDIRRNAFTNSRTRNRLPAWYNPDARLMVLGLRAFEERLVSAEEHPELPDGAAVFGLAALTAGSGALGLYLLLGRVSRRASSKQKRKRRRSR